MSLLFFCPVEMSIARGILLHSSASAVKISAVVLVEAAGVTVLTRNPRPSLQGYRVKRECQEPNCVLALWRKGEDI